MSTLGPKKALYTPLEEDAETDQFMHPIRYGGHLCKPVDPDQFFKDIYEYHQAGGFWALFLAEFLWITKFIFVVFVGIELSACTRWDVLADNNAVVADWDDVFIPPGQCWANLSLIPALFVSGTVFTLFFQIVRTIRRLQRYWATRQFCSKVLFMPVTSTGLGDLTWVDVQRRLIDSKFVRSLDELSICHRILRHENYLISMVDQDVLPIRFNLPITNPPWPYVFLSDGYLLNLRLILFNTPWSPFSTHWRLRSEYKEFPKRHRLANQLATLSRVLGLLNLLFAPAILLAQLLVFLCANAERIRCQPGSIMGRRWSNYARLYLRHYNELSHQFAVRIGMAYQSACQYLDCFVSRNLIALAETGAFIFGSASVAFFLMGIIHEQMMHLTGYWAILVAGGLLARACISFIPDENVIHSPQVLLITILGKIHHVRDHWIEQGGTHRVCAEFAQLFQYQLSAAFEEVLSAVITPFLLLFVVPHYTLQIVDFLRNYTVELPELGDVCSFAQMDVRRHGDPQWRPDTYEDEATGVGHQASSEHDTHTNSTDGKIELSLMHFHLNNPNYNLPESSRAYLMAIRKQLLRDIQQPLMQVTPELNGQPSILGGLGSPFSPASLLTSLYGGQMSAQQSLVHRASAIGQLKKISHLPGPSYIPGDTLGFVGAVAQSMRASMHRSDPGMERSSKSDSTIQKGLSSSIPQDLPTSRAAGNQKPAKSSSVQKIESSAAIPDPTTLTQSVSQPILEQSMFNYSPTGYTADPINMSWMAASALFSVDGLGHQIYRPHVSQMDNGSSQHWGVASSIFGYATSRHGLADVLTADTSASILYMHELAHRRRQQQQQQQITAGSGVFPLAGSFSGGPWDVRTSGMPHSTGGVLGPNVPYQQLPTGSDSVVAGGVVAVQLPSSTRVPVSSGTRLNLERTGPGTSRYGYGATSSTVASESGGIIRTSLDSRRLPRAAFAEIAEEDEQPISTPHLSTETHFRPYHLKNEVGGTPAGVVTVPSVPLPRMRRASTDLSVGSEPEAIPSEILTGDTDTEHVWPDLPPTNC